MQLNSVYLYPNKIDVFTNVGALWKLERYNRVYNRKLKIYRSVDNRIDLQVRNSDEKAADITNTTLVFNIYSNDAKDLVIQKDCVADVIDKGRVHVVVTEADTLGLESGFYTYTVVQEVRTPVDPNNLSEGYRVTSRTPLYIDSQYGAKSTLEVLGDIQVDPVDSALYDQWSYYNPIPLGYATPPYTNSSIIDAQPYLSTPQSLHTMALYFTRFSGQVKIQASMEKDHSDAPNSGTGWFDIPNEAITPTGNNFNPALSPLVYINIVGKYRWLRVHTSAHDGSAAVFTIQETNLGTFIVNIDSPGTQYTLNQQLLIPGIQVGQTTGVNDILITVTGINPTTGAITDISWTGLCQPGYKTWVIDTYKNPNGSGTIDKILYR